MQVFRDLLILGSADQLAATLAEVERSLADGWTRDNAAEERVRSFAAPDQLTYAFACAEEAGRPAATVFLKVKEPGVLSAVNVVPKSRSQLSYGEYNGILEEFCNRFVRPAADRTGAHVDLTATQADLEHWLTPAAAKKLRLFSAAANRNTGAAHPVDRERWNDFVVAAHEERSQLDAATLERWLTETEGWPAEVADRLGTEYEFGRKLLAFADERRSA